jgi:membrane associated rhomboid family serine protease
MTSSGAPFSNAARNLRQLYHSPASWSLAGGVLAIQLIVTLAGGQEVDPAWTWYHLLGLSRDGIFSGNIWQILTYGLLHGGWWHSGLNALFILLIGSRIEHMVGRSQVIPAVLAGVIAGGIFHMLLAKGLLVGISGGCTALLLLLTTLSPQSRMMPLPVSGRSLGLGIMAAELTLALIDPASGLPGFSAVGKLLVENGLGAWFHMGHACHFGGGLAGWLLGRWILRPRITLGRLRRDRLRREANGSRRPG